MSTNPPPRRDDVRPALAAFMLFTGPLAWFLQFCVGVALTDWPCFPNVDRRVVPVDTYSWSGTAAMVLLLLCALLSAASGFVSWRALRKVASEKPRGHAFPAETAHGRAHFIALWGTILGASFALVTLNTLVCFAMVPRCLG